MTLTSLDCPNCGAPLPVAGGQTLALCPYCNSSIRTAASPTEGAGTVPAAPTVHDVPKEVGERVKQMIVDGKRAEAIRFYAQQAAVSPTEAEAAINQLSIPLVFKLTRQAPLNVMGLLYRLAFITFVTLALAGSIWAILKLSPWFVLLTAPLGFILVVRVRGLIPQVISNWVMTHGDEAQAKILKTAIIRPEAAKGGTLILALMEVRPPGGQPPFRDDEALLILNESLPKLQPGNVIRVRYDRRGRSRVFPIPPIEVLTTESTV